MSGYLISRISTMPPRAGFKRGRMPVRPLRAPGFIPAAAYIIRQWKGSFVADAPKRKKKKSVPGWAITLAAWMFRAFRHTWRVRRTDRAGIVDGDGKPWPVIAVLWHNRIPALADFIPRRLQRKAAGLASASRDGEVAARVLHVFGYQAVRGSSSRGGFEALLGLRKTLEDGYTVALTVDGPRGPRYEVHPGAVILAEQTGIPIVPFALRSPDRWEMKGWDRMQIPKPFSKVEFIIGDPIAIPPDLTPAQRREWCLTVRDALLKITDDARAGHPPPDRSPAG